MDHDFGNVVEHLRSHAGDAVQVVLVYDESNHTDLDRRSDITDLHDSALEQRLISMARATVRMPLAVEAQTGLTVRQFACLIHVW